MNPDQKEFEKENSDKWKLGIGQVRIRESGNLGI